MRLPPIIRHVTCVFAALGLSACGVSQAIHDGAVNMFAAPIPTMNLDVVNRAHGIGPAIVRIYQLTSPHAFEELTDAQWLTSDLSNLEAELLASDHFVLPQGAGRSLQSPMHAQTQYVGVVAWMPGDEAQPVRLLIPRKQWAKTQLVHIDLDPDTLQLDPSS